MRIRPLSNSLGAELLDLDLAHPLAVEEVMALRQAWLDHLVLLVRDQDLTPAQHIAFSAQLGEVERGNALSHYNELAPA